MSMIRSAFGRVILFAAIVTGAVAAGPDTSPYPPEGTGWQSLFDGKTLGHWQATDFGAQGESKVENGLLMLTHGETLTGVTWQGPVPATMNYEIELDAERVDGSDFFCGLTFPVGKSFASLIIGGWGGAVCGISNLDDNDAANNETTKVIELKNNRWYHIRLRVEPNRLQAWLDKDRIVNVDTTDRKISVRYEVEPSRPLGLASYQSTAALKNIRLRKLDQPTGK